MSIQGFANKYRPRSLKGVVGQPQCVAALQQAVERKAIPTAVLFSGPPGTGKTTMARILAGLAGATGSDITEINAAEKRTLDDIRTLLARITQRPWNNESTARAYILDEAHHLTKKQGGDAQTALLKRLEEPPPDVYLFLCSSEPHQLLPAIRSRCTHYQTKKIPLPDQKALLKRVCLKEGLEISELVAARLCEVADGAARDALKLLDQIAGMESEDEQLEFLRRADAQTESITLFRLLNNPYAKWQEVSDVLKGLDAEPETVRRQLLGYFSFVVLSGGKGLGRAVQVINVFRDNYFDSGKAGLVADCFEVVHSLRPKGK